MRRIEGLKRLLSGGVRSRREEFLSTDKLSALLEIAMEDLEKVESMPERFLVNMYSWHCFFDGRCEVCLAGSVLSMTLEYPDQVNKHADDWDCDSNIRYRMFAIDDLRLGRLDLAWNDLQRSVAIPNGYLDSTEKVPDSLPHNRSVHSYECNAVGFKEDMRKIIADLREAGL